MSLDTLALSKNTKEYRTRKSQYSSYYRCIEDNCEAFERIYDSKYQEKYGILTLLQYAPYRHLGICSGIIRVFIYFVLMGALGIMASFMQQLLVLTALHLNRYLGTRSCLC